MPTSVAAYPKENGNLLDIVCTCGNTRTYWISPPSAVIATSVVSTSGPSSAMTVPTRRHPRMHTTVKPTIVEPSRPATRTSIRWDGNESGSGGN